MPGSGAQMSKGDINRLHGESEPRCGLPRLTDRLRRDESSDNTALAWNRTQYCNFLSHFVALTLLNSDIRA